MNNETTEKIYKYFEDNFNDFPMEKNVIEMENIFNIEIKRKYLALEIAAKNVVEIGNSLIQSLDITKLNQAEIALNKLQTALNNLTK